MVCGLDFKSPKIDCRWNSAALCAFVCYPVELVQIKFPRRSPGRRITPEARALASRPPTAGRASTQQSGRTLPPLSCRAQSRKKTGHDVTRHGRDPRFNDGNQLPEAREDSDGTHVLGIESRITGPAHSQAAGPPMRLLPNRRISWDSLHLAPGRPECLLAEPPGGRAINGPPLPGGFQVLHRIRKYSLIHPLSPTVAG